MASKTLTVVLAGDPKGAQAAFRDLDTAAAGSEARLASLAEKSKSFGDDAVKVGKSLSLNMTLPIVAVGALSLKAASDVQESQSKVEVVFGKSADAVKAWAADSAQSFGLSKAAAYEAVGTFGNLFRAMDIATPAAAKMSKQLVGLSADLASFNNANPEEVLLALRSGLVGEAEPLRKFGVSLSAARIETEALKMGLAATKDELTAGAKAQAAFSIIMQDTALAQGDFARTSDGLANRLRILKAEATNAAADIGALLLPAASKAASGLALMASAAAKAPEPLKQVAVGLAVVLAAAGPIVFISGKVAQGFSALLTIASTVAEGMQTVALKTMYAIDALKAMSTMQLVGLGAMGLAIAAIAALVIVLSSGSNKYEQIAEAAKKWGEAQARNAAALGSEQAALAALTQKQQILKAAMQDRMEAEHAGLAKTGSEWDKYLGRAAATDPELARLKARHDELAPSIEGVKQRVHEARIAEEARKQALIDVATGTKDVTTATDDAVASMQALQSQVLAMSGGEIGYQQSLINREKAQRDLDTAIKEHGPLSEEARAADLNLQNASLGAASAALSHDDAIAALKRSLLETPEAFDAEIAKLEESKRLHPEVAASIQQQIDKLVWLKGALDAVPNEKRISVTLQGIAQTMSDNYTSYFSQGGWVEGTGNSDTVPAMLTPGEFVVSKDMLAGRAATPAGIGSGGGGNSYSITVQVAPNANMAEVGRVTVEAIEAYERRSGNGWRN